MSEKSRIGTRIKALREARGVSLTGLADQSGVSKGYIWAIEAGDPEVNPTIDALSKIAAALEVTIADLMAQPKRQARMTLEIPEDELPAALLEIIKERRDSGNSLDPHTVRWLAHAKFRGRKPATKEDFVLLLRILDKR